MELGEYYLVVIIIRKEGFIGRSLHSEVLARLWGHRRKNRSILLFL
jgi:hypothetical protein